MNSRQQEIQQKCVNLSVRFIKLKKHLNETYKEYNISDQIQRSSSSIGALYSEAVYAESETDYIHKLCIAQKEANETMYWLKVLFQSDFITKEQFDSLYDDVNEVMRIITSIILRLKHKQK